MRYVVLDTETTGMNKFGVHYEGHKIIEIGAVEIIDRNLTNNKFHVYLNPKRSIDIEAFRIHGINDSYLLDKPIFSDIVSEFLSFIDDSQLIIHNASFDLGFLNHELKISNLTNCKTIESCCTIIDSLKIARKKFPGQRNSLDALCERYAINKSNRVLHSALIDAQILAHIFLFMTGEQTQMDCMIMSHVNSLPIASNYLDQFQSGIKNETVSTSEKKLLKVLYANQKEQLEHTKYLDNIERLHKKCLWKELN